MAGLRPYDSYHGSNIDSVNLGNGNLVLHIPLLSYRERSSDLKVDFPLLHNARWAQKATTCVEPIDTCGPVMYRFAQVPPYTRSGVYFAETRNASFLNKQIRYTYPNSSFYRYFGPLRTLYQPHGAGHALGRIGTTRMALPGDCGAPWLPWLYVRGGRAQSCERVFYPVHCVKTSIQGKAIAPKRSGH